jgi:dolichol-phosphate mannosyltransferase
MMIYILLPAYNEERDLPVLLERIHKAMLSSKLEYKVLLVNDGSRDRTLEVAREFAARLPMEILDHGTNKGLGAAMQTGLEFARRTASDEDILVAMDADNTHDPALIESMAKQIAAGSNVVIASRYQKGGEELGLAPVRKVLSRGASILLRIFFPIKGARDYTCGYRAYSVKTLQRAFCLYGPQLVEERGFTCMAEILIKLDHIGARISEVPLVLRYDFKTGPSKMKFARTIWRYTILIGHLKKLPTLETAQV